MGDISPVPIKVGAGTGRYTVRIACPLSAPSESQVPDVLPWRSRCDRFGGGAVAAMHLGA